jgi:hypothetical protein
MIRFLQSLLTPKTATQVARGLFEEAERAAIEHRCAAEHHRALADMYLQRARKLRFQAGASVPTLTDAHGGNS